MAFVVIEPYGLVLAFLICVGWQFCFFVVASATRSDKVTVRHKGSLDLIDQVQLTQVRRSAH